MKSLVISCLLLLLSTANAAAYCLQIIPSPNKGYFGSSSWEGEVSYYISERLNNPKILAAIDDAFAAWQAVTCATLTFNKAGTFAPGDVAFLEHNRRAIYIFWYTEAQGYPAPDNEYYSFFFLGADGHGHLIQASIALNAFAYEWATGGDMAKLDVQGEMTSLIGRTIGLDTSNFADSVMNDVIGFGDLTKRALKADDLAGLRYLYPDPSCAAQPAPGEDGCCTESAVVGDAGVSHPEDDGGAAVADGGVQPDRARRSSECGPGQQLSGTGACMSSGAMNPEVDGCDCRIASHRELGEHCWLVLVVLLALTRKRRSRDVR